MLAGATALAAGCSKQIAPAPGVFDGLEAEIGADWLAAEPEFAESAGLALAGALDTRASADIDLKRGAALRRQAQLRAFDRTSLDGAAAVTFDALDAQVSAIARGAAFDFGRFGPVTGFAPYALDPVGSAMMTLPGFLNLRVETISAADAAAHATRLRAAGAAIDAETQRARADAAKGAAPPAFLVERAATIAAAFGARLPEESGFIAPLRRRLEALAGPPGASETPDQARSRAALAQAISIVAANVLPAYRRAAQALSEIAPRASTEIGVWRLPKGEEFYAASLAFYTSSALTPEQIYRTGVDRARAVAAQLDMMLRSQGLTDGTTGERLARLTIDPQFHFPPIAEASGQLLAEAQNHVTRTQTQLARWFTAAPNARLDVRPWEEGAPYRVYQPASPDGQRPAALYLDVRDPSARARFDLSTWAHREGLPGRHLAITALLSVKNLPALRRQFHTPAFSDGWAVYAEQLADEMGLFDGDPYARLGYLRAQAWSAARLVADTGIHSGRWSIDAARTFLRASTGDTPAAVEREIARITSTPGLACAGELGRLEILRLRDRARAALGAKFDIRNFHAALLAEGSLPLPALARRMELWITSGGVST